MHSSGVKIPIEKALFEILFALKPLLKTDSRAVSCNIRQQSLPFI